MPHAPTLASADVAVHGPGASVFKLRKRANEIRALLRLLHGGWKDAPLWTARIRDAAAKLAPARDAEVMLASFDSLTARRRTPSDFDSLRAALLDEIEIADAATDPDASAQFAATMAEFARAAKSLKIPDKTAPVVWHNLSRTWAKAARAYQKAAQSEDDTTAFHDWRKLLTQHSDHARFFMPIDRKGMRGHIAQLDDLGKILGARNDLDMLHWVLRANCADDPALARLERDLATARAGLARKALQHGRRTLRQAQPSEKLGTHFGKHGAKVK